MEWVEVQAKTVDEAVAMAIKELGVASRDEVTVEILQEPRGGFLGVGRMEALVKVTPKPKEPRKRRRRRRRGGDSEGRKPREDAPSKDKSSGKSRNSRGGDKQSSRSRSPQTKRRPSTKEQKPVKQEQTDKPSASIEEQADVAKEFISGLIESLGLEGSVTTRIDEDVLYIDVVGDQTEALVGPKGSTMFALHELTRTVIQRKTFGAPRMRLDVAGYTERRREALRIYTTKLADRVLSGGEEVMLEPMNAADRKVVHDTISAIDGVISFSEGEDPNRAVVLGPDPDAPAPVSDTASEDAGEESEGSKDAPDDDAPGDDSGDDTSDEDNGSGEDDER